MPLAPSTSMTALSAAASVRYLLQYSNYLWCKESMAGAQVAGLQCCYAAALSFQPLHELT